jgi:hypothetical protein
MLHDTTLQSVFDYAKKGITGSGEFPTSAIVHVTFVEHYANILAPDSKVPPPGVKAQSDLVTYASGPMTLSHDQKRLSGEFQVWRNRIEHTWGNPKPDAFADGNTTSTVAITVSDSGQVTYQRKIKGKPIGGMPPFLLNGVYENGLFVEKSLGTLRSLSFTLGDGYPPSP